MNCDNSRFSVHVFSRSVDQLPITPMERPNQRSSWLAWKTDAHHSSLSHVQKTKRFLMSIFWSLAVDHYLLT